MSPNPERIGRALSWRTVELAGVRISALVRFLILARLLAPTDFGLLAIATIGVDLLSILTNLGVREALVQRKDVTDAHRDAAWTIGVLRALFVSVVMFAGAPVIASLFGEPDAVGLLRLMALHPLLDALVSIRTADLERELDFRPLALISLPPAVLHTIFAIALAPVIGVYAAVWGLLASQVVRIALSYRLAAYRPGIVFRSEAARQLLGFGRWILFTSIIWVTGEFALRAIVSRQLGAAPLGLYYLAARLVALPNGVVSVVVGAVLFPLHARLQHDVDRARRALQAHLKALATLLTPAYVGLAVLAPLLTTVVLGEQWLGTAPVIQLLAAAALLGIIADALISMFDGRGVPNRTTMLIAVRTTILLAATWTLTELYGLPGAATAVVLAEVAAQVVGVVFARALLDRPFRALASPISAIIGSGALAGSMAYAASLLGGWIGITLGVLALVFGFLSMLAYLDRRLTLGLTDEIVVVFPALQKLRMFG